MIARSRLAPALMIGMAAFTQVAFAAPQVVWVTGRVTTAGSKQPVAGAMVAVFDQKNRVVDYARTDASGEYTLAVPEYALNLKHSGGGFFYEVRQMVGGVGRIAGYGLKAGIRVARDAATAANVDPLTKVGVGAASSIANDVVDSMGGSDRQTMRQLRSMPGSIVIKVSAPGLRDVISVGRVYWMQENVYRVNGRDQTARVAWMDPARLAPISSDTPSSVRSDYLSFSEMDVEPGIAQPGQTVTVTVKFPAPPQPRTPFVVVGRDTRTGQMLELHKTDDDHYQGTFTIEKRSPRNDHIIAVLAYAEQDDKPGRNVRTEAAIAHAGMWDVRRPFIYNPLIVVSRNRAESALTVVQPDR